MRRSTVLSLPPQLPFPGLSPVACAKTYYNQQVKILISNACATNIIQ